DAEDDLFAARRMQLAARALAEVLADERQGLLLRQRDRDRHRLDGGRRVELGLGLGRGKHRGFGNGLRNRFTRAPRAIPADAGHADVREEPKVVGEVGHVPGYYVLASGASIASARSR